MVIGIWWCLIDIFTRFVGICLCSLDERDIPSKFGVTSPDLLYKV